VVTRAARSVAVRLVAAIAVLAAAAGALAQDVIVHASVDRPVVRENESFTYTVRTEGPVRGEPELAALERDFDVLQTSKSSRVQFVNGQTAQVTEWQMQLMPKGTGAFSLPAVRVGNAFTNTVELQVIAADAGSSAPADIFMELEAEPSVVYVQSQVVFTLRLFVGASTGRSTLTTPEVSGGEAILERLGEENRYQTTRGGRNFIVHERRYAIFPQEAGALTVGPAIFEAMVIPDRGFSRVQRFRSGSLELTVQPAVPPPPSSPNAAWLPAKSVALSEVWSDAGAALAVGVPQTRTVTVQADGLLETQLPDLVLEQQSGIRQYPDQPVLEREVTPQGLRSRRSVSLAVISQAPGEVTLAGVELPWWNVAEERWEVASLPPRTLRFAPSTEEAPTVVPVPQSLGEAPPTAAPPSSVWPIVSAVLAAGWLLTIGAWLLRARGYAAHRRLTEEPKSPIAATDRKRNPRALLRAVRVACAAHDGVAARTALLQWATLRFPAAPPRSLGALASLLPETPARQILDLEAHLYGGLPGPWDGHGLGAAVTEMETVNQSKDPPKDDMLLPLYR
jgi:hypothetical protein